MKEKVKKEKPPTPYEKDIQNTICEWLYLKKYFFWRSNNIPVFGMNNSGKRTFRSLPKYTPKGLPDIMCIHKGIFIGIEVKRPKALLRPDQVIFFRNCQEHGGVYITAYSLKDVVDFFETQFNADI